VADSERGGGAAAAPPPLLAGDFSCIGEYLLFQLLCCWVCHIPSCLTRPSHQLELDFITISAMGENRLTLLALLNIHAETTSVDAEEVIDKFALSGPHKLNFLRWRLTD